jgi:hypothetical protein
MSRGVENPSSQLQAIVKKGDGMTDVVCVDDCAHHMERERHKP